MYTATAKRKPAGFTLIELMITVAVVGILAAIAYPSYMNSVRKSNRTDATNSITKLSQAMERCYSQGFTFTPAVACPGTAAGPSLQAYYTLTFTTLTATTYTIQAVPATNPQLGDSPCMTFTLNQAGVQTAADSSATPNTKTCWGST